MKIVYVTDSDSGCQPMTTCRTDTTHLLQLSGLEIGRYDRVRYLSNEGSLARLDIQRAYPVEVLADGQQIEVPVTNETVEQVLAIAGIALGPDDYTVPALYSTLEEGGNIEVHRVEYRQTAGTEAIPYDTEYSYTSEFYKNPSKTVLLRNGVEGERTITSNERWVDGQMESSEVLSSEVTREPTPALVRAYQEGAPASALTGPDGTTAPPTSYRAVYTGRATGYSSSSGARGASGKRLSCGTVAVDPNKIPYGSLVYIASADGKYVYGYAIASDTGVAIQDGRILVDLYYDTYEEARQNGAFEANVYVL